MKIYTLVFCVFFSIFGINSAILADDGSTDNNKATSDNNILLENSHNLENEDFADPANIGFSIGKLKAEIEKINNKGTEISEVEKQNKNNYQKIIELDQAIITFNNQRQNIEDLLSGKKHPQKSKELTDEFLIKVAQSEIGIDKKLSEQKLEDLRILKNEANGYYSAIEKEITKYKGYLESVNAIPQNFKNKSTSLNDKILANKNALYSFNQSLSTESGKLLMQAENAYYQADLDFYQFLLNNSNLLYEKVRTRLTTLKKAYDVLTKIIPKIDNHVSTLMKSQVLVEERRLNSLILVNSADSVLLQKIAESNNDLLLKLDDVFIHSDEYNKHYETLLKLIENAKQVQSDMDNQTKYFEKSVSLSQILFSKRHIIPDYNIDENINENIGDLRIELYKYSQILENIYDVDGFVKDFISTNNLPESLYLSYSSSANTNLLQAQSEETVLKVTGKNLKTDNKNNSKNTKNSKNINLKTNNSKVVSQTNNNSINSDSDSGFITMIENVDTFNNSEDIKDVSQLELLSEKEKVKILVRIREKIITKLYSEISAEFNTAVNLTMSYENYEKLKNSLNAKIYDLMFWSPSNKAINLNWFEQLPNNIQQQIQIIRKATEGLKLKVPSKEAICFGSFFFIVVIVLWTVKRKSDERLKVINEKVKSNLKDSHTNTYKAIGFCIANSIATPLLIWVLLFFTVESLSIQDTSIGNELRKVMQNLFFILCFYIGCGNAIIKILGKSQIAEKHFGISFSNIVISRYKRIFFAFYFLIVLCLWKKEEPQTISYDAIGQLSFIVINIYLIYEFIMWEFDFRKKRTTMGNIYVIALPIAVLLVTLGLTLLGYYYSSSNVMIHLIESFYVCMAGAIITNVIARNLRLAAKRIAYKRWQEEKRRKYAESLDKQKDDSNQITLGEDLEALDIVEKEMSAKEIQAQTMSIVKYLMLTVLVVIIYAIWSEVISLSNYLDVFTLYELKSADGDIVRAITLKDMLFIIYAIVIAWVFLRNMSGVLEVLIFNRFKAIGAYAYSIITLCNYVCIAVASVFCLSHLGIAWSDLQWMVAALSVGLGFGLQEIFANFISGIILLFERPIRIGDIVTINSYNGVVSKIRIRATTIVDFNHKEYVAPNKLFITTPIINWSLNDTMTRIVIEVSCGYGSDIALVKETLKRLALANPYVLKEPEPSIYFLSFGDSNLNFELRVYVDKISERNPCIDSLNSQIYNEFNRLGIEIAFNQLDVYIKNTKNGQEIQIEENKKNEEVKKLQNNLTDDLIK